MNNILFVVVLYRTHPRDSVTLTSLSVNRFAKYGIRPTFAIWDNSNEGYGQSALKFMPEEVRYYHTGTNEKLSFVYNRVVSESGDVDWFVFLDDDSLIEDAYLSSLADFLGTGLPLAVPKIIFDGVVISPGKVDGVRGRLLPAALLEPGVKCSDSMVAMMSGTIVSRKVFAVGVAFDERLGFYGVDTRFFKDYSRHFKELFLLDVVMSHHTALRDRTMLVSDQVARYRRLIEAWPIVFEDVRFYRVRLFFYIIYYSVKLSVVRRNFSFLSLAFMAFMRG